MSSVRIQGHRGWRGKHPENSWIGVKEALTLPICAIEIDVVEGPNKELVVSHDPWFADKDGRVRALRDFTPQEFSRLRFGNEPNADFPEQKLNSCRIMFFHDLLSRWPSTGPTINVEIKSKAIWEDRFQSSFNELGDSLIETLGKSDSKILLQSFDWRLVQQLGMLSSYPVNWICESLREWEDFKTGYRFTSKFLSGVSLFSGLINESAIKWCADHHLDLAVWTCNDEEESKKLFDLGVNNFITDYPEKLIQMFQNFGIEIQESY